MDIAPQQSIRRSSATANTADVCMKKNIFIGTVVTIQLASMLLFQLLVIRFVGVGPQTDAYIAAQAIPTFLNAVVGSALQNVWLQRLSLLHNNVSAWHAAQSLAQGQVAVLGGTVVLLLIATTALWVPALYPGFSKELHHTTISFSLFLLIASLLNTQAALLTAALRARDQFLTAEVTMLIGTAIALLAAWILVPVWGIWAVMWIWLVRSTVIYLLLMYLTNWPWPSILGGLRQVESWIKIRPLLFGASLTKTAPLVDRFWASQAQAGGMTALGLAQQGVGGLATVLERIISMPLIPTLARLLDAGHIHEVRVRYRNRVFVALLFTGIIVGIMLSGRSELAKGLVFTLNISASDAMLMWDLVIALTGFVFVSIAGTIVMSVLYAMGEMSAAAKISISGFLLGLVLKWQFFEKAGVLGLAMAITVSYVATLVMGIALVELKLSKR